MAACRALFQFDFFFVSFSVLFRLCRSILIKFILIIILHVLTNVRWHLLAGWLDGWMAGWLDGDTVCAQSKKCYRCYRLFAVFFFSLLSSFLFGSLLRDHVIHLERSKCAQTTGDIFCLTAKCIKSLFMIISCDYILPDAIRA